MTFNYPRTTKTSRKRGNLDNKSLYLDSYDVGAWKKLRACTV